MRVWVYTRTHAIWNRAVDRLELFQSIRDTHKKRISSSNGIEFIPPYFVSVKSHLHVYLAFKKRKKEGKKKKDPYRFRPDDMLIF